MWTLRTELAKLAWNRCSVMYITSSGESVCGGGDKVKLWHKQAGMKFRNSFWNAKNAFVQQCSRGKCKERGAQGVLVYFLCCSFKVWIILRNTLALNQTQRVKTIMFVQSNHKTLIYMHDVEDYGEYTKGIQIV